MAHHFSKDNVMKNTLFCSSGTAALLLAAVLTLPAGAAGKKSGSTVMVFAAASLTDVLSELVDSFEVTRPVKVQTNMASSGTLARQIEQGGMPDVFISASKRWMAYIDSLGYVQKGAVAEVAKNDLVLIVPATSSAQPVTVDSTFSFTPLLGPGRLSIGDPAHVPAGKYAKEALDYFGWFATLTPRLLPAKDVRSALMVVEMGEAPAGIVYQTDALKSKKVTVIGTFPERSHKPIVYMAGVCRKSEGGEAFFRYIFSDAAKLVWNRYGFRK
jgi:molybdate transport system substrate-binding protein